MASASYLLPLPHRSSSRTRHPQLSSGNAGIAATADSSSAASRLGRRRALVCLSEYDSGSFPAQERPWAESAEGLKVLAAPWMKGPLVVPPGDVLDLSKTGSRKRSLKHGERYLTEKIRGGKSRAALKKIGQRIARLGELSHLEEDESAEESTSDYLEERPKRPTEENLDRRSKMATKRIIRRISRLREIYSCDVEMENHPPWIGFEKPVAFPRAKREKAPTAAEMILPEAVLARLRTEARKLKKWVKAKKAGVTDDVVDEIRATWRRNELAMVKFLEPLNRNMDRAREIIEIKTGGLVVWTMKDTLVVLRRNCKPVHEIQKSLSAAETSLGGVDFGSPDIAIKTRIDLENIKGSVYEGEVNMSFPDNSSLGVDVVSQDTAIERTVDRDNIRGTLFEREVKLSFAEKSPCGIDVLSQDTAIKGMVDGEEITAKSRGGMPFERQVSRPLPAKLLHRVDISSQDTDMKSIVDLDLDDATKLKRRMLFKREFTRVLPANLPHGIDLATQETAIKSTVDFDLDDTEPVRGTLYEREVNRLLDGLGPRFVDWWWSTPLPVDADLIPEVVPEFKPPFRLCPPNERTKLTDDELTHLRKLARPLPTHFALGKNSNLMGLAAAIIKLWEKSTIVKIAVKLGIMNTNSEEMANELKRLTGGVLLLRNKFFIILYRGKDFITPKVARVVLERERALWDLQLQEETARMRSMVMYLNNDVSVARESEVGTVREFLDIKTSYESIYRNGDSCEKVKVDAEREKLEKEIRQQERQLQLIKLKLDRSERELVRLNSKWRPSEVTPDQEFLTEEERQSFRKIGLKMDEFLLLGRRGIYDGTIASIHMHWKHRELVKVIALQRKISQVTFTASLLELESGGVLVAVEKTRRGHAIIIQGGDLQDGVDMEGFEEGGGHLLDKDLAPRTVPIAALLDEALELLWEVVLHDQLLRPRVVLVDRLYQLEQVQTGNGVLVVEAGDEQRCQPVDCQSCVNAGRFRDDLQEGLENVDERLLGAGLEEVDELLHGLFLEQRLLHPPVIVIMGQANSEGVERRPRPHLILQQRQINLQPPVRPQLLPRVPRRVRHVEQQRQRELPQRRPRRDEAQQVRDDPVLRRLLLPPLVYLAQVEQRVQDFVVHLGS